MSTVVDHPSPTAPAPPDPPSGGTWWRSVCAGAGLLLAGAPVGAVVQGGAWAAYAGGAVALVVAVGVVGEALGRRAAAVGVAVAQLVVLALAATATFATAGVARVLPGPAAVAQLTTLVRTAATEIRTGFAPVPATPALLLLVGGAFGLTAVAVHAVAVGARAPAAAAVLLLAVFAVPTALADDLLPAWMLAAAAAGLGLLLLSGAPAPAAARRAPVGAALTAAAVVLALGVGAAAGGVGTAGRLAGGGRDRAGEIGLSPFTALRGQLEQGAPTELFRVTGLPRPTYLRALTLSSYVPGSGWQPSRPGAGTPLPGAVPAAPGADEVPGERVRVTVENVGFHDYWLPLYGVPRAVDGVGADRWAYDAAADTAYSTRARREDTWTEDAVLPVPSAALLRSAAGTAGVDAAFLDTDGIDPRVAALARQVTADAPTGFDRAVALTEWFTGPGSAFRYDLSTAPGNGDDAMVEFLTRGRRGYCEQFASSMAAMLRTLDVPARVAVGFTGGREAAGEARSVRTSDAHAWVEAWFPGVGWTAFDPTPLTDGRTLVPPYVAEAVAASTGPVAEETAAPPTAASPAPAAPSAAPETDAADPTAPPSPDDQAAPAAAVAPAVLRVLLGLALTAVAGLVVAAPALWRSRLRRRRAATADAGGPGAADAAWAELVDTSTDHGAPGRSVDTVRAAARRLVAEHGLDPRSAGAVRTVAGIVEESWYGGVDPAPGALTGPVRDALDGIAAAAPLRLRRRLLPPSLVDAAGRRLRGSEPAPVPDSPTGPAADPAVESAADDAAAARH